MAVFTSSIIELYSVFSGIILREGDKRRKKCPGSLKGPGIESQFIHSLTHSTILTNTGMETDPTDGILPGLGARCPSSCTISWDTQNKQYP